MMHTVIVGGIVQWHRNGLMLYELAGWGFCGVYNYWSMVVPHK